MNNPFLIDLKENVSDMANFKLTTNRREKLENSKGISQGSNYNWCKFLAYSNEESAVGNIKNWLRYRILGELNFGLDCDCHKSVFDLYNRIFNPSDAPYKPQGREFKIKDVVLETDTMNSFATLFNHFMRTQLPPNFSNDYEIRLDRDMYFLINLENLYAEWDRQCKNILDSFNVFARLTHCLANMMLVPLNYNTERNGITKDFWDLTLIDLQGRYTKKQHYDEGFTFICENMEKLLLTDWFEDMRADSFDKYIVKPLYKGHSFKKKMPKNNDEFLKCVNGINQMIENRAKKLFDKFPDFTIV